MSTYSNIGYTARHRWYRWRCVLPGPVVCSKPESVAPAPGHAAASGVRTSPAILVVMSTAKGYLFAAGGQASAFPGLLLQLRHCSVDS